jgi:hypothetical protein
MTAQGDQESLSLSDTDGPGEQVVLKVVSEWYLICSIGIRFSDSKQGCISFKLRLPGNLEEETLAPAKNGRAYVNISTPCLSAATAAFGSFC